MSHCTQWLFKSSMQTNNNGPLWPLRSPDNKCMSKTIEEWHGKFYFLSVIFIVETQRKSTEYNGGENKKNRHSFFYVLTSLVDQTNLFTSFIYLRLFIINDPLYNIMPYPCSHFYFDINFGDRLYSKEKRAAPLFSFEYNLSPNLISK